MPLRYALSAAAVLLASPLAAAQGAGGLGGQVLYDQSDTFTRGYISQTNVSTPEYDTVSADDFVVPEGAGWVVTEIVTRGKYITDSVVGPARCLTADLGIWADGGAEPGEPLFAYDDTPVASGGSFGELTFEVPETPLAPGTYWLSVTCKGDLNVSEAGPRDLRRWFWYRNTEHDATLGLGATAVSRNDGGAYGNPPGWYALSATTVTEGFDYNFTLRGIVATASEAGPLGAAVSIGDAVPNPSSRSARIPFSLQTAADVQMGVYDVLGRRVATLADGAHAAGEHGATLDAGALAPGTYVVRLAAGPTVVARTVSVAR